MADEEFVELESPEEMKARIVREVSEDMDRKQRGEPALYGYDLDRKAPGGPDIDWEKAARMAGAQPVATGHPLAGAPAATPPPARTWHPLAGPAPASAPRPAAAPKPPPGPKLAFAESDDEFLARLRRLGIRVPGGEDVLEAAAAELPELGAPAKPDHILPPDIARSIEDDPAVHLLVDCLADQLEQARRTADSLSRFLGGVPALEELAAYLAAIRNEANRITPE